MIMGLCLLVYGLGYRAPPHALAQAKHTRQNQQLGKPTATLTLRWLFQYFMSIHLVTIVSAKQVTHLTEQRLWILQFLVAPCQKYDLLT